MTSAFQWRFRGLECEFDSANGGKTKSKLSSKRDPGPVQQISPAQREGAVPGAREQGRATAVSNLGNRQDRKYN